MVSPLPPVPDILLPEYRTLTEDNKRVFRLIYKALFAEVFGVRAELVKPGGIMFYYWLINRARTLTNQEYTILTAIYFLTDRNNIYITLPDLEALNLADYSRLRLVLFRFGRRSLLIRHSRNPLNPSLPAAKGKYFKLSANGVKIIRDAEKAMKEALFNGVFTRITEK